MTTKEFEKARTEITDNDLVKKADELLSELCKTGGRSFRMTVPPRVDDTDMIFSELIKRYQQGLSAGNAGYKEPADTDEIDVWRIEAKGLGTAYYEDDIRVIEDMLKDCDYDEGYIITKHKMNAKEYKELPEFTGF